MKQLLRLVGHLRLHVAACLLACLSALAAEAQPAQSSPASQSGRKTVSGVVLDAETGQPVVGAQVWLKDTTIGSVTDSSGRFEIAYSGNYSVLNVSFLGYETREVVFSPGAAVTVKLTSSSTSVDEVVVVGYGVQKKASVVGAIGTVSVTDIKAPVAKISNNLAGQLAGVVSIQRSGEPGVGSTFWIRGINTFGAAKTPLILVDGVERDMDLVNVEDIKEMSILKDASATAIYGVRGANGVVMITTRDGSIGKPKVSLSFEAGMLSPVKVPEMLNSVQFARMYNEAYGGKFFSDEAIERYRNGSDPDLYPNVDWLGQLYKNHSWNEKVNLSVSGGGSIAKYYISGSIYNENGLFAVDNMKNYDTSLYYQRYNFRSNVDVQVFPHTKLNINLGTSLNARTSRAAIRAISGDTRLRRHPTHFRFSIPTARWPVRAATYQSVRRIDPAGISREVLEYGLLDDQPPAGLWRLDHPRIDGQRQGRLRRSELPASGPHEAADAILGDRSR